MSQDLHAEIVLARAIHDVADFVDPAGWGAAPQLFALVPTADLVAAEPALADQVNTADELTPVAQDPLPDEVVDGTIPLDEFLATTSWPATVAGCVLVQEIVVLPPDAENDLDAALTPLLADADAADAAGRAAAQAHPQRRDARLFAAAQRGGNSLCLLQLRPEDPDTNAPLDLRTHPDLAPNLVEALLHTLEETG